ncbi:alpha/beta fold hydrolase [Nocardiopsis xinjiangensis]|uniref:alpha/beta fold hydrolase n=1 Tax=Nocardiopsis xinjiangensis TaxID=124285 RepID=UPI00037ABFA8|nr:alpha/beta hydrolase [Nocardiopsis xinjiangensis]
MPANLTDDLVMRYTDLHPGSPAGAVPVLLLHGFGTNFEMNWKSAGWVQELGNEGLRVLGPDLRGHGGSDKPTDDDAYLPERFSRDFVGLLDELDVDRVDVVGYSMGSRLGWDLALRAPERVRCLVLGGFGPADAFAGTDLNALGEGTTPFDEVFRTVSTLPGNDPAALAACARGQAARPFRPEPVPEGVPFLLAAGSEDALAAGAEELARDRGGSHLEIPGRDHVSAVSSRIFRQAVVDFLVRG